VDEQIGKGLTEVRCNSASETAHDTRNGGGRNVFFVDVNLPLWTTPASQTRNVGMRKAQSAWVWVEQLVIVERALPLIQSGVVLWLCCCLGTVVHQPISLSAQGSLPFQADGIQAACSCSDKCKLSGGNSLSLVQTFLLTFKSTKYLLQREKGTRRGSWISCRHPSPQLLSPYHVMPFDYKFRVVMGSSFQEGRVMVSRLFCLSSP
jgi:hypothetical protein